jgi:2-oxoglutarate dehydrogenase E1 component
MKRNFRKPLVLMTPKSLLRDKQCVSPVTDLVQGTFQEVIDDPSIEPAQVRRVVLCSGKVYFDLLRERTAREVHDVALVRMEQLFPFPEEQLVRVLSRFRKVRDWVWAQEESQNNGSWFFIEPRLRLMGYERLHYVGRDASASPATGSHQVHVREQAELVSAAIRGGVPHIVRATNFSQTRGPQPSTPIVPAEPRATVPH